jgi:cellulose 1,4-beta-cellobiosidase
MEKVQVTWTTSPGATSYTVYRATSTLRRATKVAIVTTSNTTYDDTTASVGRSYYYWVKASNSYGTSGFSAYNKGYRSDGRPPAPTNVQASDGAYPDKVQVTWTASSWATSYTVYRATSTSRWAKKVAIGKTPSTTYDDTTVSIGRSYYYWVKASNSYGTSGFSAYNKGYR